MKKINVIVNTPSNLMKMTASNQGGINIFVSFKKQTLVEPNQQSRQSLLLLNEKLRKEESGERIKGIYLAFDVFINNTRIMRNSNPKRKLAVYNNYCKKGFLHCEYCNKNLKSKEETIDHFVPVSRAGEDSVANYKIACKSCNAMKGAIHPEQDKSVFELFLNFVKDKPMRSRNEFHTHVIKSELNYKDFKNFVFNSNFSFSCGQVSMIIDKLVGYSNEEKFKEMYIKNPRAKIVLSTNKMKYACANKEDDSSSFIKSFRQEILQKKMQ